MLSSLPIFVIKFMSFHLSLGVGSKYFWIQGSTAPLWKISGAPSRKGTPCCFFFRKKCGPLYNSKKLNHTHLISQSGALLMCSDVVCSIWCLETVCPSCMNPKYLKIFVKSKMASSCLEICQVCAHFTTWSSGTEGMLHTISKNCNSSLSCNWLAFAASSF